MAIVVYRSTRSPPRKKPSAFVRAAKAALPAIVSNTAEKHLRHLRIERARQPDAEASPEVEIFFARNVRPGGPLPPER